MGANFERTGGFSIMLRPAEDLPGQWVAHCLELDVMSQGDSFRDAVEMIQEALELSIMDDAEAGVSRSPAPAEFWDEWFAVMEKGRRVELRELDNAIGSSIRVATIIYARVVAQQAAEHFVPFGPKLMTMSNQLDRLSAPPAC